VQISTDLETNKDSKRIMQISTNLKTVKESNIMETKHARHQPHTDSIKSNTSPSPHITTSISGNTTTGNQKQPP
jgi:hypothetical protein